MQLLGERANLALNSKGGTLSEAVEVTHVWPIRESYSSGQGDWSGDGFMKQARSIWVNKTHSGFLLKLLGKKHIFSTDMAERIG